MHGIFYIYKNMCKIFLFMCGAPHGLFNNVIKNSHSKKLKYAINSYYLNF